MTKKEPEIFEARFDDIPFASDGLGAPTYFVENIRGTTVSRGLIKLNMIEHRLDAMEQTIKAVHVVTIVTPLDQARAWAKFLTDLADRNGVPPDEEDPATESQENG